MYLSQQIKSYQQHPQQPYKLKLSYKQYSQKAFIDKVNPQFIGIAKTVQSYKKQRKKIQQQKANMDHQVSYMEKINRKLQYSLKKRRDQLKYVRSIKNRYLDQLRKKEKLNQQKDRMLRIQKQQNQQFKQLARMKRQRAQQLVNLQRKAATIQIKNQLSSLKSQDYLRKTHQYDLKRSRVQLIENQKHKMNQNYKKFFKDRNQKFIDDYRSKMSRESRASSRYKSQIKTLEQRLIDLKQVTQKKRIKLQKLSQSIDSIKRENSACSIRSKKFVSTRSKSPSEVFLTRQIVDQDKRRFSQDVHI